MQARVRRHPESIKEIYFDQKRRDKRMQQLVDRAQSVGLKLPAVPNERLDELAKGMRHQGVLALCCPYAIGSDD
ncbi:23S rRNA (guanosine(2251)-2'-O)-methyltransferase RlmB [Oligella ureolytica]